MGHYSKSHSSGATGADFSVTRSDWEQLPRTVMKLSATQTVTKKVSNSLTAIKGELNKLKRPSEQPPEAELQTSSTKPRTVIPQVQHLTEVNSCRIFQH